MSKLPIILVGGGGHCISCIDVIEETGLYDIIGILDHQEKVGSNILQYQVIGTDDDIPNLLPECSNFLITVGQIKSSSIRQKIYKRIKDAGGLLPVIISPFAHVSRHSTIEEGSIIMHQALVNASSTIGKCCIINSKALIEHEATVGDFCHVSTASCINGQVKIGNNVFIGSNTVIGNNIQVSADTLIAAGSQVLKDIVSSGIYIGNPIRKIR